MESFQAYPLAIYAKAGQKGKSEALLFHTLFGVIVMVNSGWKAIKAFGVGLALSGMIVACNEATQSAKPILPNEQTVNNGSNSKSAVTLTALQMQELKEQYEYRTMSAAQRDQKKREFFARADVREASQGLDELAQMIAVAVEDKMLRDRIYEKCMERFDGATNTLWKHLEEDGTLRLNGGWNKRIGSLLDKKGGVVKNLGNLDAAVAKFERTLNAPVHLFWAFPENWDKKTTPLVAFLPVSEGKHDILTGYDSKGNSFQLPKEAAQKRPVIVVTFNERAMTNGSLKSNIYYAEGQAFSRFGQNGAALQAAGDIKLDQAFFEVKDYDEPYGKGPPEFTCWVGVTKDGPFIQDNYIGSVSIGSWQNVRQWNIYVNPPQQEPWVIGNWGSNQSVFVQYWEDDWWFFDDWVGEHTIPKSISNAHEHTNFNPKAKYIW